MLDAIAIVVLGSGLYLWVRRRRVGTEHPMASVEPGGAAAPEPTAQPGE